MGQLGVRLNKRHYTTLWIYIGKEFFLSFVVSFLFFFIIFFINQLLLMAEEILSKNVPVFDVIKLVVFAMPSILAMSFPFGSLVGALMAVGRLSSDSELLVMRASGISRKTIMTPFVILGLLISLLSFVMNDYFLPLGTINYGKLYRELITKTPALELKSFIVKRYRNTTIITGNTTEDTIENIVIIDKVKTGKVRVITANNAILVDKGDNSGMISLVLNKVLIQESDQNNPDKFEYSSAKKMEYNIMLTTFSAFSSGLGPREMSSVDVKKIIDDKNISLKERITNRNLEKESKYNSVMEKYLEYASFKTNIDNSVNNLSQNVTDYLAVDTKPVQDKMLDIYRLEYEKKFSIPLGAFFFVFLAFPLGAKAKKSGRAVGFAVGLLVAVVYWALLLGGQTLGIRSNFNPWLAMWAPNILVILAAIPLLLWKGQR